MKSVILCAGKGSRASDVTCGKNKCLFVLPNNERILDYSLKTSCTLTEEVIVLIGHQGTDVLEYVDEYMSRHSLENRIVYVKQNQQNGLCEGLLCCEEALDGSDFLLFLGDEMITEPSHHNMIANFKNKSALSCCGFVYAEDKNDVKKTYSLELSHDKVIHLEEKNPQPTSNLMGTGNCIFKNVFLDYIRLYKRKLDACLNLSFPHVLNYAIENAETVTACSIGKAYLNFNRKEDILAFYKKYQEEENESNNNRLRTQ